MTLTTTDIFLIALGDCLASLIGWIFDGDEEAL